MPVDAGAAVWDRLEPLRDEFKETRWTKPHLLHLTLLFMGQVDADRLAEIVGCLDDVVSRHAAYETSVIGAGGHIDRPRDERHGSRRGGVAWLTLGAGARQTADLALDVDQTIGVNTYDERRRPRPHLTVARAADDQMLATLQMLAAGLELGWTTSEIVLFRSHLGPGGSNYEPLSTHPLKV